MGDGTILESLKYCPSSFYIPPKRLTSPLSTRLTPVATLKSIGDAWAIVEREIPTINLRTSAEQIIPHLGNFSLHSLIQFGIVQREELDRIDVQLLDLGEF